MNIRHYANENNKANKLDIFEKKMIENWSGRNKLFWFFFSKEWVKTASEKSYQCICGPLLISQK